MKRQQHARADRKKMRPGDRRPKTWEEMLADLKNAIERGARRYRRMRMMDEEPV